MSECCDRPGYQTLFNDRFARRIVRSYRKKGLNDTQLRMVSFLTERGIQDASVLEIGGGVGDLQVELLRRGARAATNLEISAGYEAEAASLLKQSGMADRVTRRLLDIATAPEEAEAADVVVLHRVVCCYPDYQRLLAAAASHGRRLLVFSHPPRNLFSRALLSCENALHRLRGSEFRAFVHPPAAMITAVEAQGLSVSHRHRGFSWDIVGLERVAPAI
jgi:cyclopropane fatty-acyl-phospholipid synthase-like methyltransferase